MTPHYNMCGQGKGSDDNDHDVDDDDDDDDVDVDDDKSPHCSKRGQGIGSDQCSRCLWSVAPPSLSPESSRSLS